MFCTFFSLLCLYFYCSSRMAASAFSLINSPSSIYSLIYWMYFFFTSLCCFLIPFSKFFSFFFSSSFFFLSYYYFFLIISFIKKNIPRFLHGKIAIFFSTILTNTFSFPVDLLDQPRCLTSAVYYEGLLLSRCS